MPSLELFFYFQNDISRLPHPDPKTVCDRFCLQEEVMRACDCFHPQLDLSLMNVTRFKFRDRQRPCNLMDPGKIAILFSLHHYSLICEA